MIFSSFASCVAGGRSPGGAVGRNLIEAQPVRGMVCVPPGKGLPPPNSYVDKTRLDLQRTGMPPDPFGRHDRRA